jgi:ornithine cyclodeaminase/alanine dehydrogenase
MAVNGEKSGLFRDAVTFFHAMPSMLPEAGLAGVKWVSGADNRGRGLPNVTGLILVSDADTGALRAIMDGELITAVRTAAVTLIGAYRLASPESETVGFVACGVQAFSHLDALRAVFPLRHARCFSRSRATAERFAAHVRDLGIAADVVGSAEAAVAGVDIAITSVPRNPGLVQDLHPGLLKPGCFVGAADLARTWIGAEAKRFDRILTDDIAQSIALGKKGIIPWGDRFDASLGALVSGACDWAPDPSLRTMFVHAGLGLADLAVARLVIARATEERVGRMLPR